jgi:acyl carrier protein
LLVGTNQENLLLKACVEGGAKRVYVAETTTDAYARTMRLVQGSNFQQVTPFLLGEEVPPLEHQVDTCISDLLGDIGGSKGLEACLQQLRTVTQPETIFYPQSCTTGLSAVELPESLRQRTEIHGTAYEDVRQIFAATRYPFDLRVRVHQLPPESLISEESICEQITCSEPRVDTKAAAEHQFQLTISRPATLCGFVLTLRLYGDTNGRGQFDCCYEADAPMFVPVFMPGLQVDSGDRIEGRCVRRLSTEDGRHMDYTLEGRLLFRHGGTKSFFYRLPFTQRVFEGSKFYKTLFSATPIEELLSGEGPRDARELVRELRNTLKSKLPEYMVPSAIVKMDRFPVTPNGKLDRQALPAPAYSSDLAPAAPLGPHQEILCSLFADALGISHVSPHDSFFDFGGNSVILIQLIKRIRERLGVNLSITTFFEAPTVIELAKQLQLDLTPVNEPVLLAQ